MTYIERINDFVRSLDAEAYLVGGAVRNQILGLRVKDGDYVVRLPLDELRRRLRRTGADVSPLSLRDGQTVGYRANKRGIGLVEIALPRTEVKVEGEGNQRQQFKMTVDPEIPLVEDAVRRDFTFNALYVPVGSEEIVDPTGKGLTDLTTGVIRTTYSESFSDDPLRMLRALRFVSTLGFDLSDEALGQMTRLSSSVTGLTGKGVSGTALDEFCKILMGRQVAKALRLARDTGVLTTLIPELAPMVGFDQGNDHHDMTTDEHTFTALDAAAAMGCSLRVRMALLFHDSAKPNVAWRGPDGMLHFYEPSDKVWFGTPQAAGMGDSFGNGMDKPKDHGPEGAKILVKVLRRLNADAKLIRDSSRIVEGHMVPLSMKVKPTKVRMWRVKYGDDLLADLFKHRLADCMGKSVVDYDSLRAIARMEEIREDAVRMNVPASAKDLKDAGLIDGNDLIGMGLDGSQIGTILAQLLHEVVSDPRRADREWLLGRAAKLAGKA